MNYPWQRMSTRKRRILYMLFNAWSGSWLTGNFKLLIGNVFYRKEEAGLQLAGRCHSRRVLASGPGIQRCLCVLINRIAARIKHHIIREAARSAIKPLKPRTVTLHNSLPAVSARTAVQHAMTPGLPVCRHRVSNIHG